MNRCINKYKRHIAFFFLLSLIVDVIFPTAALALTSGPSQPEVQEFQPIDVSDMVDPCTGDFSYNLPLLDIDGYPINLSYRSGVGMDQEATCVGLGWNINAGSISRSMRGIPDDFSGEIITKKMNVKDNVSYGVTIGVGGELFGTDVINANYSQSISYNSYVGYGFTQKIGFSLNLGSASVGLGLSSGADGLTISPSLSLSQKIAGDDKKSVSGSVSLGTSFNSRTGMKELSLGVGVSQSNKEGKASTKRRADNNNNNKEAGGSVSLASNGSSIMFGSPTWVPQITMPMHTNSIFGSFKIGGTIFGVDASADIAGNYSKQKLATKQLDYPSYGYLNLHIGQSGEQVMLDFNREKDGTFTEATTNLPIPNLTYDNFSIMGQGVGGSYRPFRSDIGYVFDARASNTSESNSLGIEVDLGNTAHAGFDFVNTTVDGTSGKWTDQNSAIGEVGFTDSGNLGYEPSYFKEQGEMNVDDDQLYAQIKEEKAVRFLLVDQGSSVGLDKKLIDENSNQFSISTYNKRSKRVRRNKLFSYLTLADYSDFALQKSLYNQHGLNSRNKNHIGEITTTKTDGTRYVYGLPVYNNLQKEATFAIGSTANYVPSNNMVQYTAGSDDSPNNSNGTDNFFTSVETPAYAYGYMLTAVLSADYVDKTLNGPTPDDLGTYTLFNYDASSSYKVSGYKWRTPYSNGKTAGYANFDEGNLTNKNDNKASYVFGEKDIYYLKSIETKNHIALFSYSPRKDGFGVDADNGGFSSSGWASSHPQMKLDQITLYSMPDYKLHLANSSYAPFIIKQVHFIYDYELCANVYNNSGTPEIVNGNNINANQGKLTLKEVYFTYGKSNRGKLSPYKFSYVNKVGSTVINFNPGHVDRWGNYKPSNSTLPNSKFPYTEQDKSLENSYVSLWNLKAIQLPSGGIMEIDLESDDYAFVQNKRAGEMFKIAGYSNISNPSSLSNLTSNLFSTPASTNTSTANKYLFFKLKNNGPVDFYKDYLEGIDKLYFRAYVKVNCGSNMDASNIAPLVGYEYIHGYMDFDAVTSNTLMIGSDKYGRIEVKLVDQSKSNTTLEHPISKTAWQFARLSTPKDAYSCNGNTDPASGLSDVESIFRAIADADFMKNTIQTFQGYNGALKVAATGNLGMLTDVNRSWIRLNNPDYHKLGGGLRVKKIIIHDKWDEMLSTNPVLANQGFQYGQEYKYETQENNVIISSGVASYEPSFGADENPFRKPIFMDAHKSEALFAPDNDMYIEAPLGESFFPSPNVCYSRVTITNLLPGAGKTVNEYYTARDFPTYVHELGMAAKRKKPNPIFKLFSFTAYDKFTGSQGYSIELNDMHGKPKAVHIYEEGAIAATNSTKYHYKSSGDKILNTVRTVSKNGSLQDSKIGIDYDFYADFRENNTTTEAIGVQGNLYFMFVGIYPLIVPPILPSYHREEIQLRTAVTNKVIYRYGILDKVENIHNGNITATENLLWDAESGQVLLSSTTTEFKDPIYNMTYPSHWAYEGTGGGYKNYGVEVADASLIVSATGQINSTYKNILFPGDELALYPNTKGWVSQVGNDYFIITGSNGVVQTQSMLSGVRLKVIRSGRRNLQDMKVGAISTFTNPLTGNPANWPTLNQNYGVLNATVSELGNKWQTYCGCGLSIGSQYNPYLEGIKGNYRKIKDYTYLSSRKQEKKNNNSNIRVDGTFSNFSPFWNPNAGNDWAINSNNWRWVSEATKYSSLGPELENKDALQRFSGAQYGYLQSLPVAVGSNTKYKQMGFEGFEYSDLNYCPDDHMGYNVHRANTYSNVNSQVQKYSHTGKRSIKVQGNTSVSVTKQLNNCSN